jgi:hypothetical protein
MTLDYVAVFAKRIEEALADRDFEKAHGLLDDLQSAALQAIAFDDATEPHLLATAVVRVAKIDFPRWCA